MKQKIKSLFSYFPALTVNLLSFSSGITLAWVSPMLPKLNGVNAQEDNPLGAPITYTEEAWLTALLFLAGMFGPVVAGISANKLGRKKTLVFIAIPLLLSSIMMAFAKTIIIFFIARFIAGLSIGSFFSILPMYLAEISEDHNRGTFGCLMSISLALGVTFSYAVGPFLSVQNFCLVCSIPPAVFILVFLFYNPESPYYCAAVKNHQELRICLTKLRNKTPNEIEHEMSVILNMVQEVSQNKVSFQIFFTKKTLRKGLLMSCGLMFFQQLSAYGPLTSYTQSIFIASGSALSSEVSAIVVGVVQLIVVSVSSTLIDRLGRKTLLHISCVGCSLSLVSLGVYFFLQDMQYQVDVVSWLPVVSMIMFMICFNIGLGPVTWTVMAEVFAPNVKFTASTITIVVCFGIAFIEILFFPSLNMVLGMAGTFWLSAVICACGAVFVYFILPETKGKSFGEIQKLLE